MDLALAHTFLEVVGAGSFVGAGHRLNVTQSTVSTRIRLLEQELGVRLFVRNKGGVSLTQAGVQFQRHAAALIRVWQQARQDLALPHGFRATLRIGSEAGLWNRWLHLLVPWMRQNAADVALRCEVGLPDGMTNALVEGLLDVGVMYSPQSRAGLEIIRVAEEELVFVEVGGTTGAAGASEQVYVDWGDEFRRQHRMAFPDFQIPALFIGLGTLGFEQLLRNGGSGYFPRSLVEPQVAAGTARLVPGTSTFALPIYAVYASAADSVAVNMMLKGLAAVIAIHPGIAEPAASRDLADKI
ncbi:MAG: LysR family transcriptional regulator [Stellaceae bacterium]